MLYYHNEITDDWTTDHKEAVNWYRKGYAVELNKMDPETGALEKCAEWVWQRGLTPSPPSMSDPLFGPLVFGHFIDQNERNFKYTVPYTKILLERSIAQK